MFVGGHGSNFESNFSLSFKQTRLRAQCVSVSHCRIRNRILSSSLPIQLSCEILVEKISKRTESLFWAGKQISQMLKSFCPIPAAGPKETSRHVWTQTCFPATPGGNLLEPLVAAKTHCLPLACAAGRERLWGKRSFGSIPHICQEIEIIQEWRVWNGAVLIAHLAIRLSQYTESLTVSGSYGSGI